MSADDIVLTVCTTQHKAKLDALIQSIEKKTFPKHEAMEVWQEAFKRGNKLIVAHSAKMDAVYGYLVYSLLKGEGRILKVAVDAKLRRGGIGSKLVAACVAAVQASGVSLLHLHVDPERDAAVNLYRKFGFEIESRFKDYYKVGRDAYIMCKQLGSAS
eukprot:TRINITY_DN13359_c0_g1_i1.p1 TRINITY_DN13359_c0_g1~~TRINITY_DN13359_c0_g1_i1.p1  ORF type:complete len:170 (-),score=12.31 TRINITY_DN13359_c0_g1_i1:11-484(-)